MSAPQFIGPSCNWCGGKHIGLVCDKRRSWGRYEDERRDRLSLALRTRTVIDCCVHCGGETRRSVYDLRGRLLVSGTPFGRPCPCDEVFEELKPLLLVLAQCAEVQAYGDTRVASERAAATKWLRDHEAYFDIMRLDTKPGTREIEVGSAAVAIERGLHARGESNALVAYGDARQAAERADVVAFLMAEDREPEGLLSDVAAIQRGEHVGAVEREAER